MTEDRVWPGRPRRKLQPVVMRMLSWDLLGWPRSKVLGDIHSPGLSATWSEEFWGFTSHPIPLTTLPTKSPGIITGQGRVSQIWSQLLIPQVLPSVERIPVDQSSNIYNQSRQNSRSRSDDLVLQSIWPKGAPQ